MSEKIGKWYLITTAILAFLMLTAGILFDKIFYSAFGTIELPYGVLMISVPIMATICLGVSWLIVSLNSKSTDAEEKPSAVATFFKSFLYLWSFQMLLMVAGSVIFLETMSYSLENCLSFIFITVSLVWVATALVCVLVWAAINSWKTSEVLGVIIALLALGLFVGSTVAAGVAIQFDLEYHTSYSEDYGYDGDYDTTEDTAVPDSEDYEEEETDYNIAYTFMLDRMQINEPSDALNLLRRWEEYGWGEEEYIGYYVDEYGSEETFNRYKRHFYSAYGDTYDSNNQIETLVSMVTDGDFTMPSNETFEASGADVLLHALLVARKDIYSNEDPEVLLENIYQTMSEDSDEEYDVVVEHYFPLLRPSMSAESYQSISDKIGDGDDSWSAQAISAWAYSFWARRHNDGVDLMTYTLLKAVDKIYN